MRKFEDEEEAYFHIDLNELYSLFDPDNIRDHISNSKLKGFNGHIGLQTQLRTDLRKGLSDTEVTDIQYRKDYFGTNEPFQKDPITLWDLVMECFEDLMLQILVVATVVSTALGILQEGLQTGWMEGASILLAIIIIVSVGAGNNWVKEQQFQKLTEKKEEVYMHVIRNGQISQIHTKEILVGDILSIQIGDILPVDGILMDGSEVQMDESQITGESDYISKIAIQRLESKEDSCFMISGSSVMDGQGRMLVLAVGENTQLGKLKARLTEENPPTPLQTKLESIAEDIGKIGTIAAGLTMLALIVNLIIQIALGKHCFLCTESASEIVSAFMIAVTIIVVAVPEGLPLAVTISLAFSVNKMKDDNNLVKQLSSCEIMGGCSDICSDKTGTLTQNIMTVTKLFIEENTLDENKVERNQLSQNTVSLFCESVCVNSSANPKRIRGEWKQIGNKTDCALIEVSYKLGVDYLPYRLNTDRVVKTIPFSSQRKKMTTIYYQDNRKYRVYVKGASEAILKICSFIETKQGAKPLDEGYKNQISKDVIENFADQSLRTIGLAYKEIENNPNVKIENLKEDQLESDLILIGISGIKDPLRNDIPRAIKQCRQAGIMTRMVTGDNVNTAVSIAKDAGILTQDFGKYTGNNQSYEVMEGKNFRELVGGLVWENPGNQKDKGKSRVANLQIFKQIAKELRVLARSTPDDKYLLVTGLIELQKIVAVTGDGTNDAPALKKADVGFAMGITGTEVSKEAAGIILLDDNFASIVTACKWGRNIYDSIRKFIQFQLTVNVVALFMSFMGSVVLKQSPLNSIEMLWVNIIMDTFASLALSTEPPNEDLLLRKPYGRNESIVTPTMWRNVFGQSIYQIIVLSLLLFKGPEWFHIESSVGMTTYSPQKAVHFTIFFQAFVLMQVFNEINARKLQQNEVNVFKGLFNNGLFWFVIITTFLVQYGMIEYGGMYVQVSKLTVNQHLVCLAIGAGSIIVGIIIKLIPPSLFNNVSVFQEEGIQEEDMDKTLTSRLRRKSTIRIGHVQALQQSQQKSLTKSQSLGKHGISLHSG